MQGPCRIMHRDISFTNIRIKRVDEELIPVFTDWDMSAEEGNEAHYLYQKTGTQLSWTANYSKLYRVPGSKSHIDGATTLNLLSGYVTSLRYGSIKTKNCDLNSKRSTTTKIIRSSEGIRSVGCFDSKSGMRSNVFYHWIGQQLRRV